ncbi:MAG: aminopeptidase, partial [Clostridiales bacterium]|nr:aminopeptidase [Clostridiales bacterium]
MSENAKRRALLEKQKNGYDVMSAEELKACHEFNEDYKYFIDAAKTEREAVDYAVEAAKAAGFKPYKRGDKLKPGDKIYQVNRGKAIAVMVIGQHDVHDGINISGAHIDSPRIDLKMSPLFEDHEIAFFKTHYYGGIKKYQWVNIPLELHGVIALKDGTVIKVRYGDKPEDPIFIINDLLIHLAGEQMKKGASEVVPAESMNAIVGTIPDPDDDGGERVKLAVMGIINEM